MRAFFSPDTVRRALQRLRELFRGDVGPGRWDMPPDDPYAGRPVPRRPRPKPRADAVAVAEPDE